MYQKDNRKAVSTLRGGARLERLQTHNEELLV